MGKRKNRLLALLLCAAMVGSSANTSIYAENAAMGEVFVEESHDHEYDLTAAEPEAAGVLSAAELEPEPTQGPAASVPEVSEDTPSADPEASESPTTPPTEGQGDSPQEGPGIVEPSAQPTEEPSAQPTEAPDDDPTAEPTETPSAEPTETPGDEPTETPGADPTAEPTHEPDVNADRTEPIIAVETAPGGHSSYTNYFCEPPVITVTDAGGNLASLTIGSTTYTISGSSYTVTPTDLTGKVTVVAEDTAGNKASVDFQVNHLLGGRLTRYVEATCTIPRLEIRDDRCRACGESIYTYTKKVGEPLGHEHGDPVGDPLEPCGSGQTIQLYECKRCGAYVTENDQPYDVSAETEHSWSGIMERKEPTCETAGMEYEECTKCGARRNVKQIPAPGHDMGLFQVTKQPSNCTAKDGERRRSCKVCGKEEVEYFGNSGSHQWVTLRTEDATCTTPKRLIKQCSVCKQEVSETLAPALGHSYANTGDCTKAAQCIRCSAQLEAMAAHTWSPAYQRDYRGHWQVCMNPGCTQKTERVPHRKGTQDKYCTDSWKCADCSWQTTGNTGHTLGTLKSDDTGHWYACSNEGCEYAGTKSPHKIIGTMNNCTKTFKCTVCGYVVQQGKQSHTWSSELTYDSYGHWYNCTNPNCSVRLGYSNHDYAREGKNCENRVYCRTCDYESVTKLNHNYYNSPIYSEPDGHYKKCQNGECDEKMKVSDHEGGEATCTQRAVCSICEQEYGTVNANNHPEGHTGLRNYKAPTATEKGYSGDVFCLSCDAVLEEGKELEPVACTHVWSDEQQFDDAGSWYVCTICGAKGQMTAHTFAPGVYEANENGHYQKCISCKYEQKTVLPHTPETEDYDCTTPLKCSVCGYEIEKAAGSHTFGTEFSSHKAGHWHVCTNPKCEKTDGLSPHVEDGNRSDCTKNVVCKDCGFIIREGLKAHDWDAAWQADATGHYQRCINADCQQINHKDHETVTDDEDCQTPVVCTVCSEVIEPGKTHNFGGAYSWDEDGHWQYCQNPGCKQHSAEKVHASDDTTKATCQNPATCSVCGQVFGKTDPSVHLRTELKNYVAPTTEKEGYSGDTCCADCGAVLEKGSKLDKLTETHEHVFDVEKADDTHHWKECRCGLRDGYAEHKLGAVQNDHTHHWQICEECGHVVRGEHVFEDGKCSVCGHEQSIHVHNYVWKHEGSVHWEECTICGEQVNNSSHTLTGKSDSESHWMECAVCGYASEKAAHDMVQKSDDSFHWMECSDKNCGYQSNKEAHNGDDDNNCATPVICTVCSTVMKEAQEHNWSETYTFNLGEHWIECRNEGCKQRNSAAEHTLIGNRNDCTEDVKCSVCGYIAVYGEASHNFANAPFMGDETGHWQECENGDCTVRSEVGAHAGGVASCQKKAVCSLCHVPYGELNKNNHEGPVLLDLSTVKTATEAQAGYTGDKKCTACAGIAEKGTEIPKLAKACSHNYEKQYDDEKSWMQCVICGQVKDTIPHSLKPDHDQTYHWSYCESCEYKTTKVAHTLNFDNDCRTAVECAECGYIQQEAMEHNFSGKMAFDETGHWYLCQNPDCAATSAPEEHHAVGIKNCTTPTICEDCGHTLLAGMSNHNWATVWEADENGHYHSCLNMGCEEKQYSEHVLVEDDHLCTTPVICSICNYEVKAGETEHKLGGAYYAGVNGHWQKCTNEGCEGIGDEVAHTGGTATCKLLAKCEACGAEYGEIDPDHHDEAHIEIVGYVAATEKTDGYTGDKVCMDCTTVLEKGHVIEKTGGHKHNFHIQAFDAKHHWMECDCGTREDASFADHVMGAWEIQMTSDCFADGIEKRVCTGCAYSETRTTKALGHRWNHGKCDGCGQLLYLADEESMISQQAELQAALATASQEERPALEAKLAYVNDALNTLNKVRALNQKVLGLPDPQNVTLADESAIRAVAAEYYAMWEDERRLVESGPRLTEVMNALAELKKVVEIPVVSGKDQKWDVSAGETPTFQLDTPIGKVYSVTVNGVELAQGDYLISEDWLTFSLSPKYYMELEPGEYNLTIYGEEGYSWTTFTIVETEEPAPPQTETDKPAQTEQPETNKPAQTETAKATEKAEETKSGAVATGDETNLMIWLLVLLVSGSYAVCVATERKRRKSR